MHENIKDDTLHLLITNTPFHKEEDWFFRLDNKNKNCSCFEIDLLLYKKVLNLIDLEILYALYTFTYLNHYLITTYVNQISKLQEEYKKETYSKNLLKLTKAGIILRYSLVNPSMSDHETLRCYRLSPNAAMYIGRTRNKKYSYTINSIQILELLTLNQLKINFMKYYSNKLFECTEFTKQCFTMNLCIPYASFQIQTDKQALSKNLLLFAFALRYHIGMEQKFVDEISKYFLFVKKNHATCLILILVEESASIKSLYSLAKEVDSSQSLYFLTDAVTVSLPALCNLLFCSEKEKHLIIQNLKLFI